MARYKYTRTGKAHVVTEYRPAFDEVDTGCGLTLAPVSLSPQETNPEDVGSYPDEGERCGNCPWDRVIQDELADR